MKIKYSDIRQNLQKYSLAYFLVILIVVFSYILLRNMGVHRREILDQHKTMREFFLSHKTTLTDVGYIENWMTFRYVNKIFHVPEEYLKIKLDIHDRRYPNMPIGRYSKEKNLDPDVGLSQVKKTLVEFLKPILE